jgi:hypothetical protein
LPLLLKQTAFIFIKEGDMNILELEAKIDPIIIQIAESPLVQSELQAAKVAILNIAEAEAVRAIPFGLRIIARIWRWIIKKIEIGSVFIYAN